MSDKIVHIPPEWVRPNNPSSRDLHTLANLWRTAKPADRHKEPGSDSSIPVEYRRDRTPHAL
jgi:hypothetical protein